MFVFQIPIVFPKIDLSFKRKQIFDFVDFFRFFKRCEEYFLCKYTPPDGINSVGSHIELEINIYLQRVPPQQRHIRRLVFDYLLKRECCITGKGTVVCCWKLNNTRVCDEHFFG